MIRTLWVVVVVVLAGGASGCRKRVAVFVPNTPEGNTCKRECMNVRASCNGSISRAERKLCPQREIECLTTCPGAVVDGDREESLRPMDPSQAAAPGEQPLPAGAKCRAEDLPEWQTASAIQKKSLLANCAADPAQ